MKILKYNRFLRGKILQISLILCLGFCLNVHSFSNPLIPPPMITEIYFGPGGWSIELNFSEYYGENNLDFIRMTGLYDTAQFLPGIEFVPGEVFYVTENDFETSFYINPAGDFLNLEEFFNDEWFPIDYFGLPFGDLPMPYFSDVSAPIGEESIAWQRFTYYENDDYWIAKDLPNTIGYNPFQVTKRAEFSGYVYDKNDNPLTGIKLYYCPIQYHYGSPAVPEIFTDENGHFFTGNMFCKKYFITFLYNDGAIGDTTIYIEPDSANYFEFQLDTLLTVINEIKPASQTYSIHNIPNPLSTQTTFIVEATGQIQYQKGIIKIYSNEGYIVDILPIEISGEKQELSYNLTDKSLASGIYYYTLEIGHEKKASGKMIIR